MACHGSQDQPVDRKEVGALDLAAEDCDLVAKCEDFGMQRRRSRWVLRGAWGCNSPGLPHWGVRLPPPTRLDPARCGRTFAASQLSPGSLRSARPKRPGVELALFWRLFEKGDLAFKPTFFSAQVE